ncbi:acetyltransferase [Thalassospira australica]|uniref:acetyltransferase n=1 Tax=Thalassospira australica TaxID=1528106 RepID=UPI00051A5F18|nr:acetyltransferase [Thalassospira australica]
MINLVIVGASGHARVIAAAALQCGGFSVRGFIDNESRKGEMVDGLPILGGDQSFPILEKEINDISVIIGIGDNILRREISQKIGSVKYATVIHPSAVVAQGVEIGKGTFVAASATINPGAKIGDHVIVNTNSSIDHDCRLQDFSAVSPGAVLTGGVTVGAGAMIGAGSIVNPGLEIGEGATVGSGATVIDSILPDVVCVGVPARPLLRPTQR